MNEYVKENFKPFFSIIIPAYNCKPYIMRTLRSIEAQQGFDMDQVEVIICDDHSTDGFMDLVNESDINLNIRYCQTKDREHHCPGNTRMDGWHQATGEWITFVDHDDVLEFDALASVHDGIVENNETRFFFTFMGEYYPDGRLIRHHDQSALTWMHGKFYNREWLIRHEIDFKKNLMTHEDLYFNNHVVNELAAHDTQYTIMQQETYKWLFEPDSASRKPDSEEKYNYFELHMEDYVTAGIDSHIEYSKKYPEKKDIWRTKLAICVLHMYYYYEAMLCKNGEKDPMNDKLLGLIKDVLDKLAKSCNYYRNQIVTDIYQNPQMVDTIRTASKIPFGCFVERHSFVDFIRHVV